MKETEEEKASSVDPEPTFRTVQCNASQQRTALVNEIHQMAKVFGHLNIPLLIAEDLKTWVLFKSTIVHGLKRVVHVHLGSVQLHSC